MKKIISIFCLFFFYCAAYAQAGYGVLAVQAPENAAITVWVGQAQAGAIAAGTKSGVNMMTLAQWCPNISNCPIYLKAMNTQAKYPIIFTGTINTDPAKWIVKTPVYNLYYDTKAGSYMSNGLPFLQVTVTEK